MNPILQHDLSRSFVRPLCARAAIVAGLFLAACGGGGGGGGAGATPPPPPAANQPPVATFSVAASVQAGAPLVFDASASTDPDGDGLTYSWQFGDGTHGGGAQLAHIYVGAGTVTATLTVGDGRGGFAATTRTLDVTPGPAPAGSVSTTAVVTDANGPLAGVTVSVAGGASATTGTDGKATLATALGVPLQLRFSKPGYADQMKPLALAAGVAAGYVEARLLPREAAQTLADAAAGGSLAGKDGARVTLPPNVLVDANGNAVTGAVQISMTPVDVGASVEVFPGVFRGVTPDGDRPVLLSYGTVEYVLTQNGAPVQLRPGTKATIEIPLYTALNANGSAVAAGSSYPLWSLDERTSEWIQEGTGTVVASAASPSELALRAEVGHFSWWNCDVGVNPYRPNARCCIKDEPNGPCKENSGDVCHHYGTGPNQPGARDSAVRRFFAGVRPQAVNPATVRIPASAAFTTAPAIAGGVLPMPADMDITVVSSARNGTYRGTRVFRGGPGVTEDVTVIVLPVAGGGNNDPITLPWDRTYSLQSTGEIDRYRLAMPAGPGFEVRVARAASSLAGSVKVLRPDGSTVGQQGFGSAGALVNETTVAAAGDYTIEITASGGAPGAYRLEASALGACSSVQALAVPATHSEPLGQRQVRCYDVSLAADDVVEIVTEASSSQTIPNGSVTLSTANGIELLVSRRFGESSFGGDRSLLTGIAQAGTYRVRVANESDNQGTLQLQLTKRAATVLAAPGSTSVNVVPAAPPGTEPLVLLKPAAGGLYGARISASGITAGAELHPALTPIANNGAAAARTPSPLLPVALLYSNAGSGAVALSVETPATLAPDTDTSGTVADTAVVYAFDGIAGASIAKRIATPFASAVAAALEFRAPDGAVLGGSSQIEVLPSSGIYSAVVRRIGSTGAANYTLRVNTAPPPVPLALTPPLTQVTTDLPLGSARRYTFDLVQGELIGLALDTPGALAAQASIAGVEQGHVETSTSLTGPKSAAGGPGFVRTSGAHTLVLRTHSSAIETASGQATLGIHKPVPAPTAFRTIVAANLAPLAWTAHRYTVAAGGYYLARLTSPAPYSAGAIVWAASSPLTNYAGEFSVGAGPESGGAVPETIGRLAAGPHTVTVRNGGSPATSVNLTLVDLQPPLPLVAGAGATAGAIDAVGERDYYTFDGSGGQTYTVRVSAGFTGSLRVRKRLPNGDAVQRSDPPLGSFGLAGFPQPLLNGVEKVATFTLPVEAPFGNGVYVVEVDADDSATGTYSVSLATP